MTLPELARARRVLMRRDPILAKIIKASGECGLRVDREDDIFCGLVQAIVSQQLSTKAAATIHGRVLALLPGGGPPTPQGLEPIPESDLRSAGLSRQKIAYIRDLSRKSLDGTLETGKLASLDDEAVIADLTRIKGIGRWTAEMLLIFRLARPDVLPVGDLGIVKATQKAYGLRKPPSPERLLAIGERWRPYRSVASWYLWASLRNGANG